ncbi:MAG: glycosyltransferase [Casimicrobiaceae bacterium]
MAPVTHRGSSDRVDPSPGCTFSVVICTRNRAAFLADAIRSVLDQQYPKDRYELLVVDNGSCDATRAVVESHLTSGEVPVSYHREGRLGVSLRPLSVGRDNR